MKLVRKVILSVALLSLVIMASSIRSYADTGYNYSLPAPYGPLKGSVSISIYAGAKLAASEAITSSPVTRIRTKIELHYNKGGAFLWYEESGWISSSSYASVDNDTYNVPNAQNGNQRDGFINTPLKAYSTADAITDKAYAVYTSAVY